MIPPQQNQNTRPGGSASDCTRFSTSLVLVKSGPPPLLGKWYSNSISPCVSITSHPTCWVSISHYVIHMCTTWGLVKPHRQTEPLGFFPVLKNSECDGWRRITFHCLSCLWRLRGLECLKTLDADSQHTHTHARNTNTQIYLAVESNEKWKLLKSASPFVLLSRLNHAPMWLKYHRLQKRPG